MGQGTVELNPNIIKGYKKVLEGLGFYYEKLSQVYIHRKTKLQVMIPGLTRDLLGPIQEFRFMAAKGNEYGYYTTMSAFKEGNPLSPDQLNSEVKKVMKDFGEMRKSGVRYFAPGAVRIVLEKK